MSTLRHKIDFVALVSVTMANSNGDPLNGNRPRTDYNGYGEMSDVCIKRKLRKTEEKAKTNLSSSRTAAVTTDSAVSASGPPP